MEMENNPKLDEVYRLVKENNRMLHKMRRNAFWGGILKLVLWVIFLIVPIWLYYTYVFPVMESAMNTFEQVQGAGASAQAQLGGLQELLNKLNPSEYLGE